MRVCWAVVLVLLSVFVTAPSRADAPADSRRPLPTPQALRDAEALMNEVFAAELAKRSQREMRALAARLLAEADKNESEPASQYVLLREARDRALRAGHAASAIAATDRLAATFAVDAAALKLELLTRLKTATLTGESLLVVLEYATALADERRAAEQYEQAGAALDHALVYANRSRTPKLVTEVTTRRAEVKASQTAFGGYKAALEKLATSPKDPAANLAAGQFLCLHKGQWDKGLDHLAAGGDPAWSAAAKADLARPDDAAGIIKVGDAWWDLSLKEPVATRKRLIQRSAGWYRLAHASVSGLQQTKLDKRLEAFTATGLPPISVNGEEVAAAPTAGQPWDKAAPAPWDKQKPSDHTPKPVVRNDPLFGNTDPARIPPAADDRPPTPRPAPPQDPPESASGRRGIFEETEDNDPGQATQPQPLAGARPMPNPADYRRIASPQRLRNRFSETIPKPKDGLDRHEHGKYVTQITGDVLSIEFFVVPQKTTIEIESQNWPLPTIYKIWVKMDFPDGFFGPGRHPEAAFDTAQHELRVHVWREDGDALPDPDWIYRRFVTETPEGCVRDPVRAVRLLRRWLDLYHDDATQKRHVETCYARLSAAYAANGSQPDLDALLDAETKLDRGPRAAFAILLERARHAHRFHKDTAKAAELFEQARAVARANALRDPHFRNRIPLIDFLLGKLFFATDKPRALKHALALYEDRNYGRIDAMATGRLLGNLYEAQGDLAAARKLYQEILDYPYPPHVPVSVVNEIKEHFRGRLDRLATGQSNLNEQDKPRSQ